MRRAMAAGSCSALLCLAVALFWLRFNVAPGRTGVPFPLDFLHYFVPMTEWAAERLRAGELPLWNPHACSGMPLLATLQVGVFHPATWLAIGLPAAEALPLAMALETLIAAHLAALLFRAWGHGLAACLAGAVLFVFGCVLGTSFWPPALATLVWLPAILLCLEKLIQGWRWRWWIGLALATSLQLLAGFTQYAVFCWYLALPYTGVRLAAEAVARRLSPGAAAGRLAGIFAGVAIAAGLAAIQLLPTLELVAETHRAKPLTASQVHYGTIGTALSFGGFLRNAIDPSPGLITPGYGRDQGYLGMATVLLLAAGLVSGRRSVTLPLAGVALASFVLAAGHAGPTGWVYALFAQLPTGSVFRDPQRFRVLTLFCVIALAVPGFDAFAQGFDALRRRRIAAAFAIAGALGVALAAGLAGGAGAVARTAACALLAGCVLYLRRRALRLACSALLLLLLGADLYLAIRPGSGSLRAVPVAWVENVSSLAFTVLRPAEVAELQQRAGHARLAFPLSEPTLGLGALGDAYRVECLDPLAPAAWNELQERLSGTRDPRVLMSRLPPERLATVYDLAGVRTILAFAEPGAAAARVPPFDPTLALQAPGPDPGLPSWLEPRIETNADALPRAYIVSDWEVMPRAQALAQVADGSFDFRHSVILDRRPAGIESAPTRPPARAAEIVAYAPERVAIDVRADRAGLLVLSDSWFPGWRAWVDDAEAEILLANGLFRAVALAPGEHRVVFAYEPASLRQGAAISFAALVLLCGIPCAARLRRRFRARAPFG